MRSATKKKLGDAWAGKESRRAYSNGSLKSIDVPKTVGVRVAFRNESETPLKLCWVDGHGGFHHYYDFEPFKNATIDDQRLIGDGLHIETTSLGHAFAFLLDNDSESDSADDGNYDERDIASSHSPSLFKKITSSCFPPSQSSHSVDINRIVGGYRPRKFPSPNDKFTLDLVTISQNYYDKEWCVGVRRCEIDTTPLDTSNKEYNSETLGGWPVRCEDNWDECDTPAETEALRQRIVNDLSAAASHFPPAAREQLQRSTAIYINKSQKYGPAAAPVKGRGMCFHPEKAWLERNGMSTEKVENVELFQAKEYLEDVDLWGPGGVMLHELSHAYHFHHVPDGYDNKEVRECYEAAMKEGLYDCVRVHGPQGPECRAYACENEYEYFAELSVAFLGGTNDDKEYNKWFPFNRTQLKNHDPRAYELLRQLWKVDF